MNGHIFVSVFERELYAYILQYYISRAFTSRTIQIHEKEEEEEEASAEEKKSYVFVWVTIWIVIIFIIY